MVLCRVSTKARWFTPAGLSVWKRQPVCQGSTAPAPPGAALPASAGRNPSGIPAGAIVRSQCLGQFQLSFPAKARWVPRSSGEVRSEPWHTCSYGQGPGRWCERANHWIYTPPTWEKEVRVPLEATLERNCAEASLSPLPRPFEGEGWGEGGISTAGL